MKFKDLFDHYQAGQGFDEMFESRDAARPHYRRVCERLQGLQLKDVEWRRRQADQAFLRQGITFTVYGDSEKTERIFPFDLLPRIIPNTEWRLIEDGLKQRLRALNCFLLDVYGDQNILKEKIVPRDMVESSIHFQKDMVGFRPPNDIYIHIGGIDLIRDQQGAYYVLEDNLRTPSGISYVLENRIVMKQVFPNLFLGYAGTSRRSLFGSIIGEPQIFGPGFSREADRGVVDTRRE